MLPFELTKDTPYLALSGELWSVFYEYFNRNWSCYKGFLLYHISIICCPFASSWQQISISSGNGMVSNRQLGIPWSSVDHVLCCHMESLDCNELTFHILQFTYTYVNFTGNTYDDMEQLICVRGALLWKFTTCNVCFGTVYLSSYPVKLWF